MAVSVDKARIHELALHVEGAVGGVFGEDLLGGAYGHETAVLNGESLGSGEIFIYGINRCVVDNEVHLFFFGTTQGYHCQDYRY